jgi:uncharacterized membrane protein
MKHVVFAEFPDRAAADRAIRAIEGVGLRPDQLSVNLHDAQPQRNNERPIAETDARRGVILGVAFGAVIGAFIGWLVTRGLGLFETDLMTSILTGAMLGAVIGFVGGAISGAMNPDRKLDKLERTAAREGGVVATVEVEGLDQEESIKRVFAQNGALQVDKRAF